MQELPEAQFKGVYTGNSDVLGTNWSRKVISDATQITECSIFAAAQISLMLTHLQPEQENPRARNPTEHLCRQKYTSCAEGTAASQSPLDQTERTSYSAVLQTKPQSCAKGQAKGKVRILILPT